MKFIVIIILIIGISSEKNHGIFKIRNSYPLIKNNFKTKYKHTFLCAIECVKTKDCNMVKIEDKKCEIQVNCPFSNLNSTENNGIMLENILRKKSSAFTGNQQFHVKIKKKKLNFIKKK